MKLFLVEPPDHGGLSEVRQHYKHMQILNIYFMQFYLYSSTSASFAKIPGQIATQATAFTLFLLLQYSPTFWVPTFNLTKLSLFVNPAEPQQDGGMILQLSQQKLQVNHWAFFLAEISLGRGQESKSEMVQAIVHSPPQSHKIP